MSASEECVRDLLEDVHQKLAQGRGSEHGSDNSLITCVRNLLEEVLEECGAGHKAAEAAGDESPHLLCILQFLVLPCLVDNLAQNLITETLMFQALSNTTISHH